MIGQLQSTRVVWVSHTGQTGGAELALVEAVEALSPVGVASHVLVPHDGPLVERLRQSGATVGTVRYGWWVGRAKSRPERLRRSLGIGRRLAGVICEIRRHRPDVVVTNTIATPVGALAARWLGIPHVWYVHEFGREDHGLHFDPGERLAWSAIARLSKRVIANSEAVYAKLAERMPTGKLDLVHQSVGVPAGTRGGPPSSGPWLRLAIVGVKSPGKRQEDAIRALAELRRNGIRADLTLVGREVPEYAARLKRLVVDLGVADEVTFIPHAADPSSLIARSDVVLVCSLQEAFGRVTVEAMKLGRPVIAAASGGSVELVSDGVRGLLYPPADHVALAERILRLHRDRALLNEMGRRAHEWAASRFTPERYGLELLKVLRKATAPA